MSTARKGRGRDGAVATKAGARIEERRLRNGLQVLFAERHDDPVVAVLLLYRVGARHETEREAGVSHFLEHMMFKGSESFGKGEVDLVTTILGGQINAFTTSDHTAYWFEFASDRWEKALEIEADRMRGLLLDPAELEAEKAVVLEELAMGADDPWRSLTRKVKLALFARHPYRRPVIGYADTLRDLCVEDVRDYHARFYRPDNAILVVCGDFQPSSAIRAIRRHFGAIERGAPPAPADLRSPPIAEPSGEQRIETRWDDTSRRLCIAWPTVRVGTDEDYALDLVSTVLTNGRLSRLYRRLVLDEALATSVSIGNDTRVEAGIFWLFAECAEGVAPARLEAALEEELERLARDLVPAAELRRARAILAAGEAYECETATDLAEDLGEFAVDADWRLALQSNERLAAVRARDLRDVARRFLTRGRRVVGWSLPRAEER